VIDQSKPVPTEFNFADIWEAVAVRVPEREALVCGGTRLTYAELEQRANQLAHWLADQGVQPGEHIGLYLTNCTEYLEAMLAAYKVRAVPINVNYRYVEAELRYLFDDADLVGVIHDQEFQPRIDAIRSELPAIRWYLPLGEEYESALAGRSDRTDFGPRSGDDHYVIYTGGTTGMPKGVVWRQEDAFFSCIGGGDPMRLLGAVDRPAEVIDRIIDNTFVYYPIAPLMHAAGQWTTLSWLFAGGKVVLLEGSLDPAVVWDTIGREEVNLITVVGDPVARPLADQWEAAGGYDVGSLLSIGSGGAPLSPALRDRLAEMLPNVTIADGFGSSETGAQGTFRFTGAGGGSGGSATRFAPMSDETEVLDEATLQPIEPGSGVIGRVARTGHIPLSYYNDPEKTAATFVEVGGRHWVLTGDMATVEEDGSIHLLGRGSVCINTGGEKVFPEEVEGVLKAHPRVYDAVVVGVPDERWGQRVVAVVQPVGDSLGGPEAIEEHCRAHLAGYKVPRQLIEVERVVRSPAGKADYQWARKVAEDSVPSQS
jgi:3-oxocholest-4-en-26-oate---CoA ligase